MAAVLSLHAPRSAHPSLLIDVEVSGHEADCTFSVVQLLPSDLIVDRFQLMERCLEARLVQANATLPLPAAESIRITAERDLEAPVYVLEQREAVIVIDLPRGAPKVRIDLPLHLRYQRPFAVPGHAGHRRVIIPAPVLVQTCTARQAADICFDALSPQSALALLPAGHHRLVHKGECVPQPGVHLLVPAASQGDLTWVEPVNNTLVWLAFFTLLYVALASRTDKVNRG